MESYFSLMSFVIFGFGMAGLTIAYFCIRRWRFPGARRSGGMPAAVFLFRGQKLVDACPSARQRLGDLPQDGAAEPVLAEAFSAFPGISEKLAALLQLGRDFDITAPSGALRGRSQGDWRRVEFYDAPGAAAARVAEQAPIPIWRQTDDGAVAWGNAAWRALARNAPPEAEPILPPGPPTGQPRRVVVARPGNGPELWLDVTSRPDRPGGTLNYAIDVSAQVRAEQTLRNFVDTLTMTFAHLPIGLAVFDRDRRLALFNPALSDLTRLDPAWLAGRPDFYGFLDRLRERHRMPEPKDYRGWRHELARMEEAAAQGTYQATWPLASGETFRITGRPHPEGALAFLFEDITSEVTLKRRYRAKLEVGYAMLDRLDCMVAVFAQSGTLTLANASYRRFAGLPEPQRGEDGMTEAGEVAPERIGIVEATRFWQERTEPTPVWGDLRDFAAQTHDRAEWTAEVRLKTGELMSCRFSPLPQAATLCLFMDPTVDTAADYGGA